MITGVIKNKIDKIWTDIWAGGLTMPFKVIEQLTYLMSIRSLDQQAINNACITSAQQAGSHLKGRVVSDIAANGDDTSAEFDHFYAAYERLVEKEIKGEMSESYSIIHCIDPKKGEYEMQTFFIVNESAATRARIRAMENALKESEVAQRYAQKVSDFVKEGFANE